MRDRQLRSSRYHARIRAGRGSDLVSRHLEGYRVSNRVSICRRLTTMRAPLGYFVTFRALGTGLQGDERGSVDGKRNRYGTPRIPANRRWHRYNERSLSRIAYVDKDYSGPLP